MLYKENELLSLDYLYNLHLSTDIQTEVLIYPSRKLVAQIEM